VDVPATGGRQGALLGRVAVQERPERRTVHTIAALRDPHLRTVLVEDHAMVLRLLADRHQDLTSLRTQAVCARLHAAHRGVDSRWGSGGGSPLMTRHPAAHHSPDDRGRDGPQADRSRSGRGHRRLDRQHRRGERSAPLPQVAASGTTG